jgi:hypothetical protein
LRVKNRNAILSPELAMVKIRENYMFDSMPIDKKARQRGLRSPGGCGAKSCFQNVNTHP